MPLKTASLRRRGRDALRGALPDPAYAALHQGYDLARRRYYGISGLGRGRVLPDYLIIGAAKGGTTTLYAWLGQHPLVEPAVTKQINFFDWNFYLGSAWYRSNFPLERDRARCELQHGRSFMTGEATPTYLMYSFLTAERAAATIPNVKLIVMLREPVDRAYSQYKMARRMGWEPLPFEEANAQEQTRLEGEIQRMSADYKYRSWNYRLSYIGRSRYADELKPWLERFPRERFHFVKTEELAANPRPTLDAVHAFLGLPPHELSEYRSLNVGGPDDDLADRTRAALTEYFKPHNRRLYDLVGVDFGWQAT